MLFNNGRKEGQENRYFSIFGELCPKSGGESEH